MYLLNLCKIDADGSQQVIERKDGFFDNDVEGTVSFFFYICFSVLTYN